MRIRLLVQQVSFDFQSSSWACDSAIVGKALILFMSLSFNYYKVTFGVFFSLISVVLWDKLPS